MCKRSRKKAVVVTKPNLPQIRLISLDLYDATLCNMLNTTVKPRKFHRTPVQILDFLFLGTWKDADNFGVLRQLGITHVINCAAMSPSETVASSLSRCGIFKHMSFYADDIDDYDITQHFKTAVSFIEEARCMNGRVFVHCIKAVNRSVAILTAYLLVSLQMNLFEAVSVIHKRRRRILTNPGFRKQLILFAGTMGLLEDINDAGKYCTDLVKYNNYERNERKTSPLV